MAVMYQHGNFGDLVSFGIAAGSFNINDGIHVSDKSIFFDPIVRSICFFFIILWKKPEMNIWFY
jgi:hypothetical protein